jgi:hypothetical protein
MSATKIPLTDFMIWLFTTKAATQWPDGPVVGGVDRDGILKQRYGRDVRVPIRIGRCLMGRPGAPRYLRPSPSEWSPQPRDQD